MKGWLDRTFAPIWAGSWDAARLLFVFSQLIAHLWRTTRISDAYAASDMVFTTGLYHLADYVTWSVPTAWAWWTLGLVGLVGLGIGGRWAKPGLVAYLVGAWALMLVEALDIKAHDRLAMWIAIGMLISPMGERGLAAKDRSPVARWYLLIVFSAIYGSTGLCKIWYEPGWFDGTVLQYHLVHRWHADGALAVWVSGHRWLTLPMCWWTLAFELLFPILVWIRRVNPWMLLLGVGFHLGILFLMNVGPFSFVAVSAYPVLLDPERAKSLGDSLAAAFRRSSR